MFLVCIYDSLCAALTFLLTLKWMLKCCLVTIIAIIIIGQGRAMLLAHTCLPNGNGNTHKGISSRITKRIGDLSPKFSN